MKLKSVKLNQILNFVEIKKLFLNFYNVTGLPVALFNSDGVEELSYRGENCICDLAKDNKKCISSIKYGGEKSNELSEPYIFASECGLIMCSLPVVFDDMLIGSIACGPVMLWDVDEFAEDEFDKKIKTLGIDKEKIDLSKIKQLSCVNMTSAAQMLFILVKYICNEERKFLEQRLEIAAQSKTMKKLIDDNQQSRILGEYIKCSSKFLKYPIELEKELIAYVQLGNKTKAKEILNDFLGEIFFFADGDLEIINAKLYELFAFLSRSAVEAGAPLKSMAETIKKSSKMLLTNVDFQDVCALTIEILDNFINIVYETRRKKHSSQHLANAIEYINKNFTEQITLESLSKQVYVSTYYLSRLFRNEMNITFLDYLTRVRIEHAKLLIKTKNLTLEQLTSKIGFNNSNYFAKIFKKNVGMTPAKYRQMILENK